MTTKKPMQAKVVFAACFLLLMLVLGAYPVYEFINNQMNKVSQQDVPLKTSFRDEYPLDKSATTDYSNPLSALTEKTEQYLNTKNPLRKQLTYFANGLYSLNQSEVFLNSTNSFVKLSNGYLAGCYAYCPSEQIQNNIMDFAAWLNEQNIPLLNLIVPDKADDSMITFPTVVPCGYAQMHKEYLEFINQNNIPYLDSKEQLLAQNNDFYSWFYKGDHHWNVEAGFLMAQETAKCLNNDFHLSANADALNKADFELVVYENNFLGSYGRWLGEEWKEDLAVLYPTLQTTFHIEIPAKGIDKVGSFSETLLDETLLKIDNSYLSFLGGDTALIRIENLNCQNGTRVLVLKTSYADIYCPYLANTVQYLDIIDPRYFDGSIRSFIEKTTPDIVIFVFGVPSEEQEGYLSFK